jgi:hypothetical protein
MTDHLDHEQALDLLAGHIDGTLGPEDAAAMTTHVASCDECTAIIADDGPAAFDESAMRRSVRRTLLRTAAYATGMVFVLLFVIAFGSTLLIQPLLMNLGDRAAATARATYALPLMLNEGLVLDEFTIASGVADRTFTAALRMPVGSSREDVGTVQSRVTLGGIDGTIWPFVDAPDPNPVPAREVLGRLGDTSVATVSVPFDDGLPIDGADAIVADPGADVTVTWAGFLFPDAGPMRVLGAPTCAPDRLPDDLFGASSASAGGTFGETSPTASRALGFVAEGVRDTLASDAVLDALPLGWADQLAEIDEVFEDQKPDVASLVITGPATEILAFMDLHGIRDGRVLATDTFNWVGSICR